LRGSESGEGNAHNGEDDVEGGEDGEGIAAVDRQNLTLGYINDQVGGDEDAAGSLPDVGVCDPDCPLLLVRKTIESYCMHVKMSRLNRTGTAPCRLR
jgi:hypothetical protein